MSEDFNSALNRKEKELFSANKPIAPEIRHNAPTQDTTEIPNTWGNSDIILTPTKENSSSFGLKFLLLAGLIFLIALAYAGFRIVSKNNIVSNEEIVITLEVKPYVEGGELTTLSYSIENKNSLPLLNTNLTFTYEKGTGEGENQNKIRERIEIGNIEKGETIKGELQIQLFGAENTQREIQGRFDYKVQGSNAVFNKNVSVSTILKSPPVSILIDAPPSVSADEPYPFSITVKNNTGENSDVLMVSLTLPSSYVVRSTSLKSINRNQLWRIDSLAEGEEKKIEIDGYFKGQAGEQVSIKSAVGSQGASNTMGNVYAYDIKDLTLQKASLIVSIRVNQDSGGSTPTLTPGSRVNGIISYENTSDYDLTESEIIARLSGPYVRTSLYADNGGLYDSIKGTIIWNKVTSPSLDVISPKEKGDLSFSFEVGKASESPISVNVSAKAKNESQGTLIEASASKSWNLQGTARISGILSYKTGPYSNTGPIPPKVNENTSYAITMKVSTENNSTRARASLTLPLYVAYLGTVAGSGVIYNEKSRTISWDIGDLPARSEKSTSFQIMFHPSQTHVGQMPTLTSQIAFEALDSVTGLAIKKIIPAVTTLLTSEGGEDMSRVVQ